MSASMLVYCVGVATYPGLCPIAKETASAAPTLCTEYGPDGWMVCVFVCGLVCRATPQTVLCQLHSDLLQRITMTPNNVWGCFYPCRWSLGGWRGCKFSVCKCVSCSASSRRGRVLQVSTIYSPVFLSPHFPVQ